MAAARGGAALGRELGPLARGRVEGPEVVVVVEGALLGTRELAAEEEEAAGVAGLTHGVAGSRQRGVGAGDATPGVRVDLVDEQVVEEGRHGAVVGLAAEEEELVRVAGRGDEGGRGARGRRVADDFGDFEELLLLFLVLGEDGVEVGIVGVAVVVVGGVLLGLFACLLLLLLGHAGFLFGFFGLCVLGHFLQ